MSSQGDCDRELDIRRSSVAPHGATSAAEDCSLDIDSSDAEEFPCSLGFPVSPLECDVRTSIDATCCF